MLTHSYVLLSGGVDSSTVLAIAASYCDTVTAVSVHYGQKHTKELDHARKIAKHFGAEHHFLDLSQVIGQGGLSDPTHEVPDVSYADITGVSPTYVPFRNGLMLSALASFAHGHCRGPCTIFYGAHAEDAEGGAYPDCTQEFVDAMREAIRIGTYNEVYLNAPLLDKFKSEIVTIGDHYMVPWTDTWSCYKGEGLHCGTCPTCRSRREAFARAGVEDPTVYASEVNDDQGR